LADRYESRPMATSWTRFRRDKTALAGVTVIALIVTAALLAPWLAPFDPSFQSVDGLTEDGCQLVWQDVETVEGDIIPQCVAYCPWQ